MFISIDNLKKVTNTKIAPSFLRDYFFKTPAFYPNGEILIEVERNGQQVAPFVAPIKGGKVLERSGSKLGIFTPPQIAPQRVISQADVLKTAGTTGVEIIDSGSTPESRQAKLVLTDFAELDETITRREEWMCGKALITGEIAVTGDGYKTGSKIVFWDQSDKPLTTLSGAALWSATSTADPIGDIEDGIAKPLERGGIAASDVVMTPATWKYARNNEKLLKALDTDNLDVGEIFGQNIADKMGVRLVGRIGGAKIWTYSGKLKMQAEDGTVTTEQVIPDGYVLFGNPNVPTEMAYGVCSIQNVKAQKIDYISAKRVPNQRLTDAGVLNELKTAALPVPKLVDGFYVYKVL